MGKRENGDLIALSHSHRCPAPQGQDRAGGEGQIEERRDGNPSNGRHGQTASTSGQRPASHPQATPALNKTSRGQIPRSPVPILGLLGARTACPPRFAMPSTPLDPCSWPAISPI